MLHRTEGTPALMSPPSNESRFDRSLQTLVEAGGRRNFLSALGAAGVLLLTSLEHGQAATKGNNGGGSNGGKKKRKRATAEAEQKRKSKIRNTNTSKSTST